MDRVKAQAMKKQGDICVSWWESGRVSQNKYIYRANGISIMILPDLPADTVWNEFTYYKLLVNEKMPPHG